MSAPERLSVCAVKFYTLRFRLPPFVFRIGDAYSRRSGLCAGIVGFCLFFCNVGRRNDILGNVVCSGFQGHV